MIFTMKYEIARNKFLSIGFSENEIPIITVNANQFIAFLKSLIYQLLTIYIFILYNWS